MRRGAAKVEFYQNIDKIREAYSSGLIVYKILFEHLQKSLNLKMSYRSFYEYAKIEFSNKKSKEKPKTINIEQDNISKVILSDNSEDVKESMQEYMKNMEHILKRR